MSNNASTKHGNLDAIINIGLVLVVILLQSWIADGIQGGTLFAWLNGGVSFGDDPVYWGLVLTAMIVLVLGIAWILYQRRRTFLPFQIQRIGAPDDLAPHAVLVMTISHTSGWRVDNENNRLNHSTDDYIDLNCELKEVLNRLAVLGERKWFSWEQLLRAVNKHAEKPGKPDKVILLGSPGEGGTARRFEECRSFIRRYFSFIPEKAFEVKEADFDNLEALTEAYQSVVRTEGHRKSEIMIDVTGGTKVVSIAAAIVTLQHPEIEFQYVETHAPKRIRSFNVIGGGVDISGGI